MWDPVVLKIELIAKKNGSQLARERSKEKWRKKCYQIKLKP